MTFYRLFLIHRSGGRSVRVALRLAWESISRDRVLEREHQAARQRAQQPFVHSR